MKDAPAFDFYPERWLVGTAMMSDAEQLSYLRLLCHQWLMDGLPDSVVVLRRLAGRGITETVLEKFPPDEDGKRRNARLELIRSEQRARIAKRQRGAEKTNDKRWQRVAHGVASVVAHDIASESPPPTTHHPPRTATKVAVAREARRSQPDAEWLAALAAKPVYAGIDIHEQFGKAETWCATNNRLLSRRFFVNWLNRAEKPMSAKPASPALKEPEYFKGVQ